MFFDHYPYTNFHNINLDWVLQAVKAWGQTVEANDRAFQDLKEANEDFKAYVTNYLQDLDITDEINTKLDAMLASGVLTPYFAPYVQGYVNSWLNSHVTPTSPALDNTLTLSGAAARADAVGHRLKDLAYIDALSTPEVVAALNRSQVLPGYRVQGITYDYNGHYYVCGGSVDEDGTGVIVKMTKPDFSDAEISVIPQLGHANDITYYNGYLYVCTVGGGDAPRWGIYKINVNNFSDKTLISNAPENTIGISYRQGDFWILAPYRIYRTTDFTSYEVVVENTNDLMTDYGIPTSGRISQTIFRTAGYLIGWVCSFVSDERHYGAITFFSRTGQPVAFKMFPAYHSEIQGAVYADMSIYLLADGNLVNVFRMDPRHLSYVQLKAGDDLNSFTGRGTLYSTGSNVSAELLNSPSSGEGFTVQVDRLGVYNTIQTARTNSGRELYRVKSFSDGTWGEWIEPATEVTQIKDDLSTYLTAITGGEPVIFTRNSYYVYSLQGTKVSLTPTRFNGRVCALSPCVAGDRYIITLQGGGGVALGWSFCDEAGNVLTRSATNVIVNNALITAPAGSRYAVFNDTHQSETVYAIKITGKSNSRLLDVADLKVIAFGDSICRGGRNRNKGFIGDVGCKYVNMGVGGATLSNVTDSTASTDSVHPVGAANIPDQLIKYAESSAESWYMEPDVIIAEGGTNDYPRSALGTIPTSAVRTDADAEALDRSTVMGGLAYMFYSMVKLYPMAYRFFLLTNRLAKRPWTAGAMGYTQTELNNAIRAVCKLYGVKVIDVFSDSPVDSFFSQYVSPTAYTTDPTVTDLYCIDSDQVHPLALGYKIGYAPFVREALATAIRFS